MQQSAWRYERCVIDTDAYQSGGGIIICDTAEGMEYDREHVLQHCEYAENEAD